MKTRLQSVLDLIDEANGADPSTETVDGRPYPKALLYGMRMSDWLHRLEPEAAEPLQIAARAQHIRRWLVPRSDFAAGRAGYLAWRTHLYGFHGEQVSALMEKAGYDQATIARVAQIVSKKRLKQDPDAQRIEDVACLVFLSHEFAAFAALHPHDKVISIVRKTWGKMSEAGREAALGLTLPDPLGALIEEALQPDAISAND